MRLNEKKRMFYVDLSKLFKKTFETEKQLIILNVINLILKCLGH